MFKKILNISLWVLLFGGILSLLGFAENKRNTTVCKNVDIRVIQNDTDYFITPADVRKLITDQQGELIGKTMDKINIMQMEKMLAANPYIADAQIYATLDGNVELKIAQKKPIVRVINEDGESYYLDSTGGVMPLSTNFTTRSLIVNGYINEPYNKYYGITMRQMKSDTSLHTALPDIYKLSNYIYHDPFWRAQITQVYMDSAKDFCLVPRVGNQRIIFGDASDIDQKFNKLWVLYREGLNSTGKWNEYSTINLKYKYQIVCTKK
jgi:cell division protein FtsQ